MRKQLFIALSLATFLATVSLPAFAQRSQSVLSPVELKVAERRMRDYSNNLLRPSSHPVSCSAATVHYLEGVLAAECTVHNPDKYNDYDAALCDISASNVYDASKGETGCAALLSY